VIDGFDREIDDPRGCNALPVFCYSCAKSSKTGAIESPVATISTGRSRSTGECLLRCSPFRRRGIAPERRTHCLGQMWMICRSGVRCPARHALMTLKDGSKVRPDCAVAAPKKLVCWNCDGRLPRTRSSVFGTHQGEGSACLSVCAAITACVIAGRLVLVRNANSRNRRTRACWTFRDRTPAGSAVGWTLPLRHA